LLPPELLEQIQNYVQGEHIYIPQRENTRLSWGKKSGARQSITFRNKEIIEKYNEGYSLEQLCDTFCLSHETIRKIIYASRK